MEPVLSRKGDGEVRDAAAIRTHVGLGETSSAGSHRGESALEALLLWCPAVARPSSPLRRRRRANDLRWKIRRGSPAAP